MRILPKHDRGAPWDAARPWGLSSKLGEPDALEDLASELWREGEPLNGAAPTDSWLRFYFERVMAPLEFPFIQRAAELARGGQARELVALDRELSGLWPANATREASRRAGLKQLRRLRPLADLRVLSKYREAVQSGKAHGWHVVVYGLVLAIYSIPTRQGLSHYAEKTLAAMTRGNSPDSPSNEEFQVEMLQKLPRLIEQSIRLHPAA